VQVALDAASSEVQAALDAVTAANQSTAKNTDSLITASNSTSAVIKEIAAYAALAGCGFLAYKVIRK
jgi:ribosomal protein L30E